MDPKFTLRDILAYFFVGFYTTMCFLICLDKYLIIFLELILDKSFVIYSKKILVRMKDFGFALFSIPFIYLIGVLIQATDNFCYDLLQPIYNRIVKKKSKIKGFSLFLSIVIFGQRPKFQKDFPQTNKVPNIHFIEDPETSYWSILHQSNEGLYRTSILFFVYNFIAFLYDLLTADSARMHFTKIIIFLVLMILFWKRGRIIVTDNLVNNQKSSF